MTEPKRLMRSATDKKLLGVCGGLGKYLDIDPTVVRIVWVILTIVTAAIPGIIAYFVVALVMPEEASPANASAPMTPPPASPPPT
ncbi:MAG: PspC domain-containing protein [Thermoplasmatota archaeon]